MMNALKSLAQWKGSIPQLIGWFCKKLRKQLMKFGSDEATKSFLLSGIKIGMHLILILTIAGNLGVDKTSVAALVGSAGVAISLALQGGLSNFAGGVRSPWVITSLKTGKRPRERCRRLNCITRR